MTLEEHGGSYYQALAELQDFQKQLGLAVQPSNT